MALDYGNGVSRTLSAIERQFGLVIWQEDRPPLDSELNLMGQVEWERLQSLIRSLMPSGFLMDPTRATDDYQFNKNWSNLFVLGNPKSGETQPVVWANVNGWVVPVAGTDVARGSDLANWIKLYPAPETDGRVDLVFLEVWQALVGPNPSEVNKPTAATIWKYGNVKYGGTNVTDDIEDPAIGHETTQRVQVQYRIRVHGEGSGLGAGVALDVYPDGLGDPNVLGQGTSSSPVGGFAFENMREALGDPGLWRAGDGDPSNDLGTVDGYVYAIPICAVFRRNSNTYVAVASGGGNPNQNGAFERNPGAKLLVDKLDGARELSEATLTAALSPTATGAIQVTNLNGSGLEDGALVMASTFLVLDNEIVGIEAVSVADGTVTISSRGRFGTAAVGHPAGTPVKFYTSRPDGLYADEIAESDVLDLRRAVNPGDWDYQRLLAHNVVALAKGHLKTAWKKSATGDTEGVKVHEVDYLHADGSTAAPNHTEAIDGPDGIRTVWSDAATIQPDVTILLDNEATTDGNAVGLTTADQFDTTVAWDVGPDFKPTGFLNLGDSGLEKAFTNGSTVFLHIGGEDGNEGARGTVRGAENKVVRFVTPKEYWKAGYPLVSPSNGNQHPVTLRFLTARSHEPAPYGSAYKDRHPGPMFPWRESNFERPFIVLGGLLHSSLKVTAVASADFTDLGNGYVELDLGVNFDTSGVFFTKDSNGDFENDPTVLTKPLMRGQKTLWGMLTDDGRDMTGASSEVYVVIYGDTKSTNNNGAFKVVGAGTVGFTTSNASNSTSLVLKPLSADFVAPDTGNGETALTVEFRSQYHNAEDTSDYTTRTADLAIVLTDIGGIDTHPWNADTLGKGEAEYDLSFYPVDVQSNKVAVASKALISTTLMYHPGRGGMLRVPEEITRFAMRTGNSTYLQQPASSLDNTFEPAGERFFHHAHVQTWNRLPALGWHAPDAPNYGGNVVGYTEQDRENQLFVDKGSKTLIFRPFREREMTLQALSFPELGGGAGLLGSYAYPDAVAKDGLQILTDEHVTEGAVNGQQMAFPVPREYMPRFGRQDIPFHTDTTNGTGTFLTGINHLFVDKLDATNPVFHIIGGPDNASGGNKVENLLFATGTATAYGHSATLLATVNNKPHYGARRTSDINALDAHAQDIINRLKAVNSSDLGRGLKGIQLPPYQGIARLIGVYELEDYKAKGGRTFSASPRNVLEADPATNLLREDASKQTLFILKDGAKDLTGEDDDHTYIIPQNVLDLTRIPGYVAGQTFDDFHYVVEAVTFTFAKGWINKNNYVLCRKHNGQGTLLRDGEDPELEQVPMVLPCAASSNEQVYVAYNRTPYQGDVFMTRNGSSRVTSDYTARYGQVSMTNQNALRTAVQQYDTDGNFVPQTPNARGFEVLAALDFYTTLGTGKVGGRVYPGTPLDVGFTENTGDASTRMPKSAATPAWRVLTRAFTEGQKGNTSRASLTLDVLDVDALNPAEGEHAVLRLTLLDGSVVSLWASKEAHRAALIGTGVSAQDIYTVDTTTSTEIVVLNQTYDWGSFNPGETKTLTIPAGTMDVAHGDTVIINALQDLSNGYGAVLFDAWIEANDDVTVRATYTMSPSAFEQFAGGNVRTIGPVFGILAPGDTRGIIQAWPGATASDAAVVVNGNGAGSFADLGILVEATPGVDIMEITVRNISSSNVDLSGPTVMNVALIQNPGDWSLNVGTITFQVRGIKAVLDTLPVAQSLVDKVNSHPSLQRTVTAKTLGSASVVLEAIPVGEEGNNIRVAAKHTGDASIHEVFRFNVPRSNNVPVGANVTSAYLSGGVDLPVNAGDGTSQISLTGMTERFPLGALLQDSDFLGENPLGDNASAMKVALAGLRPIQTILPLTEDGGEYSRFMGAPGELLGMADGAVCATTNWTAWTDSTPTGTKKFRIYRGGGSAFVLSGRQPGGPIDWISETFPAALKPVLKGGVLACRALLVRNFYEEAFTTETKVSDGDEIQMVLLTYGILGDGTTVQEGVNLSGIISPTGYGEGYAAADRYRIQGRPLFKGYSRVIPDPADVTLAVYPEDERGG